MNKDALTGGAMTGDAMTGDAAPEAVSRGELRGHEEQGHGDRDRYAYELGQGLIEYGLIIMLIAVVAIAILSTIGVSISSMYSHASTQFPT